MGNLPVSFRGKQLARDLAHRIEHAHVEHIACSYLLFDHLFTHGVGVHAYGYQFV
jgi:hypothetical protein